MKLAECKFCGKEFAAKPYEVAKYCSRKCFYEGFRRDCYLRRKRVTLTCKVCGKKFEVVTSLVEKRKTCSRKCMGVWESRIPRTKSWKTMNCEVCGKEFHYYPRPKSRRRYCSSKCMGIGWSLFCAQRRKIRFEEIPENGKQRRKHMRKHLKELGGDTCELCGWKEASVDICHIIPRKDGGETVLSNIVFLCPNHHRMYDEGLIQREHLAALARKRQLAQKAPLSL